MNTSAEDKIEGWSDLYPPEHIHNLVARVAHTMRKMGLRTYHGAGLNISWMKDYKEGKMKIAPENIVLFKEAQEVFNQAVGFANTSGKGSQFNFRDAEGKLMWCLIQNIDEKTGDIVYKGVYPNTLGVGGQVLESPPDAS